MMDEIEKVKRAIQPTETLFVVDSMTGQDAVNTAKTFDERIDFDGVVTKPGFDKAAAIFKDMVSIEYAAYALFNFGSVAKKVTQCAAGQDSSMCRNGGALQSLATFGATYIQTGSVSLNLAEPSNGLLPDMTVTVTQLMKVVVGDNEYSGSVADGTRQYLLPGFYFALSYSAELKGASWIDDLCRSMSKAMSQRDREACSSANIKATARAGYYINTVSWGFSVEFELDDPTGSLSGTGLQCHVRHNNIFGMYCKFGYSPPILLEQDQDDVYMITNPNCNSTVPTDCVIAATNMTFAGDNRAQGAVNRRRRLAEAEDYKYHPKTGKRLLKDLSPEQHKRAQRVLREFGARKA